MHCVIPTKSTLILVEGGRTSKLIKLLDPLSSKLGHSLLSYCAMATAQVHQVMEAPVHDDTDNCVREEEEKNHEIIQGPPCTEAGERASDVKVHENDKDVESKDKLELEVPATDTDEGQGVAQEVELAKFAVHEGPAETEAKGIKEGRLGRGAKKTEKAAAKGAIVPVDDSNDEVPAPGAAKKKAEKAAAKWAVVPVDDEADEEVVALAGDQDPKAAPLAFEEAEEAAGEEATKGGKEDAREEKALEE
uniref:Uncharacterized protein n=1 Tax=Avena sativa TaxID=4498 RepID=A0ACD5WRV9_AVESA